MDEQLFGLNGDLDNDGVINALDNDIDGDGIANLNDRTAYDNGVGGVPTFAENSPIVVDFSGLSDGASPFQGGFTGLAQTSNGTPELNYANNTATGSDSFVTAPAIVQNGRLLIQTTNDNTGVADSGFTFLADTGGESFVFEGLFDNPVFNGTALQGFSQYGLILSLTGAPGVTGANFIKLTTGNPGGALELSGSAGYGNVPKPSYPVPFDSASYAQVRLQFEGTVANGSVSLTGKAIYLDANGGVLFELTTSPLIVPANTAIYNAFTGAAGAPPVAFGLTSTDSGPGGPITFGVQNLTLSRPEPTIDPPGPARALNGDLDNDGIRNALDSDIDGDGIANLNDRTAYDDGTAGVPTVTENAPIVLDFSGLPDGSTPFEGGFTGLAQTANGSAELNYANNTASGGDGFTTAPAVVQNGRLLIQTTNDDTPSADSGFTFLADTGGENFVFEGLFDNPVFNGTALQGFSQYGLMLSLTGADGVTGADYIKLTTGNPGAALELSGSANYGSVSKPNYPSSFNSTSYFQVRVQLEGTVENGAVSLTGKASYLDQNGAVLFELVTNSLSIAAATPIFNALTGVAGAPPVAFGLTSTDLGTGGPLTFGVRNLTLSRPEEVIVEPPGPDFGLEVLTQLTAADGIATGGVYAPGQVGAVELDVMAGTNNVRFSNFGAGSFKLTNTGDKKIAAVFIDFRDAIFGDSVIDFDGSGGDTAAKPFVIDGGGTSSVTGAFFDPSNSKVYYLPGDPPLPNTTGTGLPSSGGFRGLLLKAGNTGNGFQPGESVGFSGDMDPNSIAGLLKTGVDSEAIAGWDVGGVSGAEIAGSRFFVLFDDGTTASGVLANSGTQAGSIGRAVQGQVEVPVNLTVNGGSGFYGDGGAEPNIVITGTPGQNVKVTLAKGFQPVANDANGYQALVEARLADSQPGFQVNNAFDIQSIILTIGQDGTVTVPPGAFNYKDAKSGEQFEGDDVAPIAISAVAIDSEGFALGQVDREYLTNPTQTPVEFEGLGYFLPSGSGSNLYYKIQIEDAAALNGGVQPKGLWNYLTAPDEAGRQTGFQGTGYYLYGSNTSLSVSPANATETLEFEIEIPESLVGATMTFRFRGSRDGLAELGDQNDAWLNIARKDGTGSAKEFLVDPANNEIEPVSGDFIKIFGGPNNGNWGYVGGVDAFPNNPPANFVFPEAGRYVLQIAGRSQGFHIDWIELFTGNAPAVVAANSVFVPAGPQPVQLVNEIPNQVLAAGVVATLDLPAGTFLDPDGDPISYELAVTTANGSNVGGLAIDEATGQISGLNTLAIGTYTVTITANDDNGTAADSFELRIVDGNQPFTIEAESITKAVGYRLETLTSASGGAVKSLVGDPATEVGSATFTFGGATGTYNVLIGAFDENDGVSTLSVTRNGVSIGSILLNQNLGSGAANANTKVTRTVASEVTLTTGDTITVTGIENAGEHARFDFIRFELIESAVPTVSIAASQNGAEPSTNGEFIISLNEALATDTIVNYTVGGTATAGSDYTALTGSVTILAGQTTATLPVAVLDDALIEGNETVSITLTGASGGVTLEDTQASIIIADNDQPVTTFTVEAESIASITGYRIENNGIASGGAMLSFAGGANNETGSASFTFGGATGTYNVILGVFDENDGVATLQVSRNGTSIGTVALDQNLGNGGAVAATKVEKLVTLNGAIAIASGDTITINGFENLSEHARFDFIRFESVGAATPTVSIEASQNGSEPNSNGQFTVTLSATRTTDTVVNYTVGGTATAGADYTTLTGSVTILAGQTTATIPVAVLDDALIEGNETVSITLTGASGGVTLGNTAASLIIADNDQPLTTLTVEAESITSVTGYRIENNGFASGGAMLGLAGGANNETGSASFTFGGATGTYNVILGAFDENDGVSTLQVSRNGTSIGTVALDQNLGNAGAVAATKVEKLVTINGAIAIASGDTITINGFENVSEHARFDFIRFEAAGPAVPTASIAASQNGAEPGTNGEFTVSLSEALTTDTVVNYSVGGTATAGADYTALTGSVTVLAGQTTATIPVAVLDDSLVEGNETVSITLTGASGGVTLGNTAASLIIADNDQPLVPITFEAESPDLVTNYRVENLVAASGGQVLSLVGGANGETGSATFEFGPDNLVGTYDIILGTFDENDGVASFTVELIDAETSTTTQIGSLVMNANLGSGAANVLTKVSAQVATGISLTVGDSIRVTGLENGGEHARLDFLQLVPTI